MGRARQKGRRVTRRKVRFRVRGDFVVGDLILPAVGRGKKPPVLVMGHGFGTQKDFGLDPFAQHFAARLGLAVLLFDYRTFGESEGTPRQLVDPWRHGQDWDGAIDFVRACPDVDGSRISLWGSSFGGGHALCAAARHPQVRAVVSQVPFVSGISSLSMLPLANAVKGTMAGLRDLGRQLTGRPPYLVPIIGKPGSLAAMASPESYPGYSAIIPAGSSWKNEMPARIFLTISFYRPMSSAHKIQCPVLLVGARDDSLVPIKAVAATARRIKRCDFVELECNHFQPYVGEWFQRTIALEADFLAKHAGLEN